MEREEVYRVRVAMRRLACDGPSGDEGPTQGRTAGREESKDLGGATFRNWPVGLEAIRQGGMLVHFGCQV